MPFEQQDLTYRNLLNKLAAWRTNAPGSLQLLGELDDDESLRQYKYFDIIEYVGCVEAYEKATIVYLHKVAAAGRPDRPADQNLLDTLVYRILFLIEKLARGIGQLAILCPLFIAGREAHEEGQQKFVRGTMILFGIIIGPFCHACTYCLLILFSVLGTECRKRPRGARTSMVQTTGFPRGMD